MHLALPRELLYLVCAMLGVGDVLNLSSTCRRLSHLCSRRTLWLDLIDELDFYETPDFPPHLPLTSYSTEELRKRAIDAFRIAHVSRGKGALRFTKLARLPIIKREQTAEQLFRKVDPLLLPGRRRLLVNNQGCLELWSVEQHESNHRCLWKTDLATDINEVAEFHGEVVELGVAISIAGVFLDRQYRPRLRVYKYHEATQTCSVVFETELPPNAHASYILKIQGNYVLLYRPLSFEIWVCDVTSGSIRTVSFSDQNNGIFRVKSALLVEDILVVAGDVGDLFQDTTLRVFCIRMQSLLTSTPDPYSEGGRVSVRILKWLELQGAKARWGLALNAFRPSWKRRANPPIEVFVVALGQSRTMTMHSFRLQLDVPIHEDNGIPLPSPSSKPPDSSFLQMHLKQSVCATCTHYPLALANSLSNSGLFFTLSPKFKCFAAFCDEVQPSLMHPKTSEYLMASLAPTNTHSVLVNMEPWSGSISIGSEGMVSTLELD